jgi:hypothetical protein
LQQRKGKILLKPPKNHKNVESIQSNQNTSENYLLRFSAKSQIQILKAPSVQNIGILRLIIQNQILIDNPALSITNIGAKTPQIIQEKNRTEQLHLIVLLN